MKTGQLQTTITIMSIDIESCNNLHLNHKEKDKKQKIILVSSRTKLHVEKEHLPLQVEVVWGE